MNAGSTSGGCSRHFSLRRRRSRSRSRSSKLFPMPEAYEPTGRRPILHGMDAAEPPADPDVARLFAPVAVEETFAGVLIEATSLLSQLDDPVDAELWGSDRCARVLGRRASLADRGPDRFAGARRRGGLHSGVSRPAAGLRRDRLARL